MNFDAKTEQLGDETHVDAPAGEVGLETAPEFTINPTRHEAVQKLSVSSQPPA